jgi:hypothetical protein
MALDASAKMERCAMRRVLIGSKPVTQPGAHGYEAVAASASSGGDAVTAEGAFVADAPEGASVVVDVSSSSFDDAAVLELFETSVAYFGEVEHSFRLVPNARSC